MIFGKKIKNKYIINKLIKTKMFKKNIFDNLKLINIKLNKLSAEERILWSIENLPENFILTSSFGIQSSICLHLITRFIPNITVVLIDTGYMFPETYRFIDKLEKRFNLNIKIFRSKISSAWQEAKYGKLWEQGLQGIKKYNLINKVQPMNQAIKKLNVKTWFAGLRKEQSQSRKKLKILSIQKKIFKFLPILDWNKKKSFQYIKNNKLDINPLFYRGYLSVGDIHTSMPYKIGMKEEDTRFFGLKRECGIHE